MRLADFGAFVNILPGKDGLVHISQITDARVQNVADFLKIGDVVKVKVLEVDRQGPCASLHQGSERTDRSGCRSCCCCCRRRAGCRIRLPYMKEPTLGRLFCACRPAWRRLSPCSFWRPLVKGDGPASLAKGIAACHGPTSGSFPLVWIVILGTFMVRTTFFMVWPFLSILLYRDYGLSATLMVIGLILGPRRRFPRLSASMAAGSRTNGGRRNILLFWLPGVRRQCGPARPLPTRWAGWHSG